MLFVNSSYVHFNDSVNSMFSVWVSFAIMVEGSQFLNNLHLHKSLFAWEPKIRRYCFERKLIFAVHFNISIKVNALFK